MSRMFENPVVLVFGFLEVVVTTPHLAFPFLPPQSFSPSPSLLMPHFASLLTSQRNEQRKYLSKLFWQCKRGEEI